MYATKKSVEKDENQKKTKKKRMKNKTEELDNITGVHKIVISEEMQKLLNCEVGKNISVENPWIYVNKRDIMDNLETTENSIFLPLKTELQNNEAEKVFLGYIPDETNDIDEFYICATEDSDIIVSGIVQKLQEEQNQKLMETVVRTPRKWTNQGSEEVVTGNLNKNNRAILQVLLETKYPFARGKTQFRLKKAELTYSNYTELCNDTHISIIFRKIIENSVQVAPDYTTNEAQTVCTFPKNAISQYKYEFEEINPNLYDDKIDIYFDKHNFDFSNMLTINGLFNLYTNDYHALTLHGQMIQQRKKFKIEEYITYTDFERCKGKMVEALTWHPMLSWIFVVSYSSYSSHFYISEDPTDDEVFRTVHSPNPVLVWSTDDYLQPKLMLESPREIMNLSFCPYDGNIIIGGCKNGQVIIWDIRDKIEYSERYQALNLKQQLNRKQIYSVIGWQTYLHPVDLIRPILISELKCSHTSHIVGIRWRSPYHDFTKTGQLIETDDDKISMQFETCGMDGTIFLWDMCQKLSFKGTARLKRLRRLKRRPRALKMPDSPYKNLNLRPIYKVVINKNNKNLTVTHASIRKYSKMTFEEVGRKFRNKISKINDRITFRPVIERMEDIEADMHIGTIEGEYAHVKWEGQDLDDEEIMVEEKCKFLNYGRYHNGPVLQATINANGVVLTVGGSVFALWKDDYQDGPILWRKLDNLINQGRWHENNQSRCNIVKNCGIVEHWMFHMDSYKRLDEETINNGSIFAWKEHPRNLENNVVGIGDQFGNVRLHYLEQMKDNDKDMDDFCNFIQREIAAKKAFLLWQKEWGEKYIEKQEDKPKSATKKVTIQGDDFRKYDEIKKPKKLNQFEMSRIKWKKDDKRRIQQVIREKTKTNMEELEWQKKPFEKIQKDNMEKKQKLIEFNKQSDELYKENLETLFPKLLKQKSRQNVDPYVSEYSSEEKSKVFDRYQNISNQVDEFIKNNSYQYQFNLKDGMSKGKERKNKNMESVRPIHPHRFRIIEERRKKLEEQRRAAEEQLKLKEEPKKIEKKRLRGRLKTSEKLKVAKEVISEISKTSVVLDEAQKTEITESDLIQTNIVDGIAAKPEILVQ